MSFGFSVGDFIAVLSIIKDITSNIREAGSEYQELFRELEALDGIFRRLDKLQPRNGLEVSVDSIKCVALTCRHPLEKFLEKIKKYEEGLGPGSRARYASRFQQAGAKMEWALKKKGEDCARLRTYLGVHIGTINMMLTTYGIELHDVASHEASKDNSDLRELVTASRDAILDDSGMRMIVVRSDLSSQVKAIDQDNSMIQSLFGVMSGNVVAPLKTLAEMVGKVWYEAKSPIHVQTKPTANIISWSTQQIYNVVSEIRSMMPSLDRRFDYFQTPVRVEDALGHVFPVPSEYSFGDLEAIINHKFKEGPGAFQVRDGDYEIFNSRNRKYVVTSTDKIDLLPGMHLTMAVVLERLGFEQSSDKCPIQMCNSQATIDASGGGRTW